VKLYIEEEDVMKKVLLISSLLLAALVFAACSSNSDTLSENEPPYSDTSRLLTTESSSPAITRRQPLEVSVTINTAETTEAIGTAAILETPAPVSAEASGAVTVRPVSTATTPVAATAPPPETTAAVRTLFINSPPEPYTFIEGRMAVVGALTFGFFENDNRFEVRINQDAVGATWAFNSVEMSYSGITRVRAPRPNDSIIGAGGAGIESESKLIGAGYVSGSAFVHAGSTLMYAPVDGIGQLRLQGEFHYSAGEEQGSLYIEITLDNRPNPTVFEQVVQPWSQSHDFTAVKDFTAFINRSGMSYTTRQYGSQGSAILHRFEFSDIISEEWADSRIDFHVHRSTQSAIHGAELWYGRSTERIDNTVMVYRGNNQEILDLLIQYFDY
jgi:hypothetical protein